MKNNPLHVTLIEDDEDDRFLFSIILDRISVATELTVLESKKDIESNIRHLESLAADIVFLGYPLLPHTEIDYLKKIRSNSFLKDTFCVILTGYCHPVYLSEVFKAGANLCINKPHEIATMINLINKLLTSDREAYHPPKFDSFLLSDN
jgi:DNA-binding NarL/FixJ family response regulator